MLSFFANDFTYVQMSIMIRSITLQKFINIYIYIYIYILKILNS